MKEKKIQQKKQKGEEAKLGDLVTISLALPSEDLHLDHLLPHLFCDLSTNFHSLGLKPPCSPPYTTTEVASEQ